jgi:hypothetical protein
MARNDHNPVTLKAIDKVLRPSLNNFVQRVSFESEVEVWRMLNDYPQLIHIMNHGPMLGPWPAAAYLAKKAVDNGGGDRTPFGMFHRTFFKIPGLKQYIAKKFNSDHPFTFEEILDEFEAGAYTDFMVLPEGDFCNFGDMTRLRPFRSHRYVELAVRLGAPIAITAHRGTELWAIETRLDNFSLALAKRLLPKSFGWIAQDRVLNLQTLPFTIPYFRMKVALYHPELKASDLSQDPDTRAKQIEEESNKVRAKMEQMLQELDHRIRNVAKPVPAPPRPAAETPDDPPHPSDSRLA